MTLLDQQLKVSHVRHAIGHSEEDRTSANTSVCPDKTLPSRWLMVSHVRLARDGSEEDKTSAVTGV